MTQLLILVPLRIEARALRRGCPTAQLVRVGMGPKAAARAGEELLGVADGRPVVVAGFCGGLRPEIRTGDVVVASEIRGPEGAVIPLGAACEAVADALRAQGLTAHVGPIAASEHVAFGTRGELAAGGALGVDMESFWLLRRYVQSGAGGAGPVAVVRAVSDTAGERFLGGMLPLGWLRAYRSLRSVGAALGAWEARADGGPDGRGRRAII